VFPTNTPVGLESDTIRFEALPFCEAEGEEAVSKNYGMF